MRLESFAFMPRYCLFSVIHDKYIFAGLPSSPPSGVLFGEGPTGSPGDHQYPITADFVGKNQKMNPRIIIVVTLSAFVLFVVCCAAVAVLLKYRNAHRPSNAVGPVFTPSMNKRMGTN